MAIAFQSAGVSPGASSTTCVITAPTGIAVGDLLIASCTFDDGGASTVSLSGWTVVKLTQNGFTLATLAKIADSGDTSAGTFTFTTTGSSGSNIGGMMRISGTASTLAIAIDTVIDSTASGTSRTSNASANTITLTDDIIVAIGGARDDSNWSVVDMTNTQNGSTMSGFTATERVDANTLSGNDTSIAMDTVVWDGTGTGLPFGNMTRSTSISAMGMQMFVVHAPVNYTVALSTVSIQVVANNLVQALSQALSAISISVSSILPTVSATNAKWNNTDKNDATATNVAKNAATATNTAKNSASVTNQTKS